MSNQSPFFFQQFRKADGTPLVNGNLYTYVTESVIPKEIFYDREETLPCPNPLPLDDSGFVPQYYLGSGLYTFVLKDKDDQTVATRDNIEGVFGISEVTDLVGAYLPLTGGSLTGNLNFDFNETGAAFIKVYQNHLMYRRRAGGPYIDLYFNNTNESKQVLEVNSTGSDQKVDLKVSGNVSATSFVVSGGTSAQYLRADGSVGSIVANYLPLSGGDMFRNAEVSFVSSAATLSSVGVPTSISIVRHFNENQNAFAGIDIENHTGFGIKITNEDDSLYSAARFINNADPEKEHSSYALELTGPGRSLYAENDVEIHGNIYSAKLGTGIIKAVNGVLTSGTSADYGLFSTGAVILPELTDLGGAFVVQQGSYRLYSTDNFTGELKQYDNVTGGYFVPNDNVESYLVCNYNSGTPTLQLITDKSLINNSSIILLYTVWRQDTVVHSCGYDTLGLGLSNKTENYIRNTQMYKKSIDGGLFLSENGSRNILVTSAVVYSSVVPQTVNSFNSSTDILTLVSGGVYTDQTQYDNTNYNGGVLTNNKFGVRWFFRSIGDANQVFYVLGSGEYNNVEDAKLETVSTINTLLKNHCVLIGRIIIQKGAASGLVENVSETSFSSSQVQNHNDLANIQGGQAGEYYHLNASQYNSIANLSALQEPTGFSDKNQSMSYNFATKTFNISAASGFNIYYRGQRFAKTSDSLTITGTGPSFIWYTSAGVLTATYEPWDISTSVQVAYLHQTNDSVIIFGEERHGTVMDWATHKYNHKNNGTLYTEGFTGSYLVNNDNISFGLTDGKISDEDLEHSISHGTSGGYFTQPLILSAYIPVYYYTTAAPGDRWVKVPATNVPYHGASNQVYFNQGSLLAFVGNNNFVSYYIFATNNISEPIISIMGQRQDTSLANAQINQVPESLSFYNLPTMEMKLLYQVILNTNTSYTGNPLRSQIQQVIDFRNQRANNISLSTAGAYLPLTGGVLLGPLSGTNARFSGTQPQLDIGSSSNSGKIVFRRGDGAEAGYVGYVSATSDESDFAITSTGGGSKIKFIVNSGEAGYFDVNRQLILNSNLSAANINSNGYRVPYILYSSAYAISGLVGGTPRMILNVTIPAGLLNTRKLRVTFTYGVSNAGAHGAYISASFGGQVFNDSTMGLGNTGDFDGKYTLQIDSLIKGSSGKFSIDSCAQGKFGPTPTHIHSQQNYMGNEFSPINLNNAQNLSILIEDNSASSTIYVYQPLIEVL